MLMFVNQNAEVATMKECTEFLLLFLPYTHAFVPSLVLLETSKLGLSCT